MKIGSCALSKNERILRAFYDYLLTVKGDKDKFSFYTCFKAISSFYFIQIFFTYKQHAKKINVSLMTISCL